MDIILKEHIFFFQKQSLNIFSEPATRSLKNSDMFLEAVTHTKNISCTLSFRTNSCSMVSFRSSRLFFKKQEIYSEAATHLLKHKKYIQKQLHIFFHSFRTKYTYLVRRFFITFQWSWKTSSMVIRPSLASVASNKLLNTKILLNHVVFTKMMVGICCPSLIFFYDVTSTPLYINCIFRWWWYSSCLVVVIFHAYYYFHWTKMFNELEGQTRALRKLLLSERPPNNLVWKTSWWFV